MERRRLWPFAMVILSAVMVIIGQPMSGIYLILLAIYMQDMLRDSERDG
jgi:hypothetical protein